MASIKLTAFSFVILSTAGIITLFAAFHLQVFHRADRSLLPAAWSLAVAGLSFLLMAAAWQTKLRRCAGYFALALVGQAVSLLLVAAPSYGVLQHYVSLRELAITGKGLLPIAPLVQTIVVIMNIRRLRTIARMFFERILSSVQAVIFVIAILAVSVYGSWNFARYLSELLLAAWLMSVNVANLLLVAATIPAKALESTVSRIRQAIHFAAETKANRMLVGLIAFTVTAVTATISWYVFDGVPHIADSVGYLFQAKHFAVGHLYLPAPPDTEAFQFEKLHIDRDRWWNYGFPGWPAVLAPGVLTGFPWLVNPVLAGITILLAHHLLIPLYSRSLAYGAILLLCVSPWFLFMSASFMPHSLSVVLVLLLLTAVQKGQQTGKTHWGVIGGVSWGALLLTRPLDAMLAGFGVALWAFWLSKSRLRAKFVCALILAAAFVGGLILAYNQAITGNYFYPPHSKWADARWYPGADRLGFGADVGNLGWHHLDPFPGHGPVDVFVNALQNLFTTNVELFGWSFGSIGFALLFLLWHRWQSNDRLAIAILACVIFGHSLYWFSGGPDFGARYWYVTLIPFLVLTVRGIEELQKRWVACGGTNLGAHRITAFVVAASLASLINFMPWRSLDKYHRYNGISRDISRLAGIHEFGHALVFIQVKDQSDYPSAFIFNPPTLQSPGTIYARDPGVKKRSKVARHFPDRKIWIVSGPETQEDRFHVIAGPFSNYEVVSQ